MLTAPFLFLLMIPFILFENLHPFQHIVAELWPEFYNDLWYRLLLLPVFAILTLVIVLECGRMWLATMYLLIVILQYSNDSIARLSQYYEYVAKSLRNITQPLQLYRQLIVVFKIVEKVQTSMSTCLLSAISAATLLFNFTTIKMYNEIPMPSYLVCPIGMILSLLCTLWTLPMAVAVHEDSKVLLRRWKFHARLFPNKRMVLRQLKAIQPLGFKLGLFSYNFFILKKSTKSSYFDFISNLTISVLLSMQPRINTLSL